MENKIIKTCYGNHNSLKIFLYYSKNYNNLTEYNREFELPAPILCRQIGINLFNEESMEITNRINDKYLHNAYINQCMKEIIKKYDTYMKMKWQLNFNIIQDIKTNIPRELFLEIQTFL